MLRITTKPNQILLIMCGIVCAFDLKESYDKLRPQILEMSKKVRHRGPDWSGIHCEENAILAHERLAIVDPASGKQPLYGNNGKTILAVNGEIYNHREIRKEFENKYNFLTESDCEVILALYEKKGVDFLDDLNGIFGFALYDSEKDEYLIAINHYKAAMLLNSKNIYLYPKTSWAFLKLNENDSAMYYFEKALAIDSLNAFIWYSMGRAYRDLEKK